MWHTVKTPLRVFNNTIFINTIVKLDTLPIITENYVSIITVKDVSCLQIKLLLFRIN